MGLYLSISLSIDLSIYLSIHRSLSLSLSLSLARPPRKPTNQPTNHSTDPAPLMIQTVTLSAWGEVQQHAASFSKKQALEATWKVQRRDSFVPGGQKPKQARSIEVGFGHCCNSKTGKNRPYCANAGQHHVLTCSGFKTTRGLRESNGAKAAKLKPKKLESQFQRTTAASVRTSKHRSIGQIA